MWDPCNPECQHYYKKSLDIFGTNGAFAKNQKGKMGIFAALSGGLSAIFTGLIYIYACLKARAGAFGIGSITQYNNGIKRAYVIKFAW